MTAPYDVGIDERPSKRRDSRRDTPDEDCIVRREPAILRVEIVPKADSDVAVHRGRRDGTGTLALAEGGISG